MKLRLFRSIDLFDYLSLKITWITNFQRVNIPITIALWLTAALFLPAGCNPPETAGRPTEAASPTQAAQATRTPTQAPSATPAPTRAAPDTPTPPPVAAGETAVVATKTLSPTESPAATPTPVPTLNGIPIDEIVVADADTLAHMREVYALGREKGRNPRAFSKIGDSVIANADFLTRYDAPGAYTLGPYAELQDTIDHFSGSWVRYGVGIKIALRAWGVFDPLWADKEWCEPNEVMIDCEFRLNNPSVVLIKLGSNDQSENFEVFYRKAIERALEEGVMPVLLTKADRFEGENNRNNKVIRRLAAEYRVPLVDFDVVAATLPNRGLRAEDDVHLNGPLVYDYNLEETFEYGHSVQNLIVIMMLDRLYHAVIQARA